MSATIRIHEPAAVLTHERLGRLRGLLSEGGKTVQFRGIRYAEIPGRWRDPVILDGKLSEEGGEYYATGHGPACPQHPAGFAYDLSLVGENVSLVRETEAVDELGCLNLVVVKPVLEKGRNEEKLPVMVWYSLLSNRLIRG